jgi:hypothetical protein
MVRLFLDYPDPGEFEALERCGVYETEDMFFSHASLLV